MRSFIALTLPEPIKEKIANLQQALSESKADVKWVEKSNIHLTLKFLGEIDQETLEKVKSCLKEIVNDFRKFNLGLDKLKGFPSLEKARVIWIGTQEGSHQVTDLATQIEETLQNLGIAKEQRPFRCHITLGRIRSPKNLNKLAERIKILNQKPLFVFEPFQVDKITLFESILLPSGPVYRTIAEYNLG
ncbi:MAG: RNA 2',3'-cyclic phosphodiesterase [Candidatus Omnitrophica bacterium]|nr:RNA 2',3'-cyclic phosphodiesterase [Candidatus Omnitrophota bacterium]